jgi:hypothetical protein
MRWLLGFALALCLLLGVYLASPLLALQNIASAVEARDAEALTQRIDFPSLRQSFTKQIVATYFEITGRRLPLGAMSRRLVVSVAEPVVAQLMTVRALLDLLAEGEAGKAKVRAERAPFTSEAFQSVWSLWLSADYLGRDFYIYLPLGGARNTQFRVHLRLKHWRWTIVSIELPEELRQKLARELVDTRDRSRRAR